VCVNVCVVTYDGSKLFVVQRPGACVCVRVRLKLYVCVGVYDG